MKKLLLLLLISFFISKCTSPMSKPTSYKSYRSLHEKHFNQYNFTTEKEWDSLNNYTPTNRKSSVKNKQTNYKTFGWHLYSNGSSYTSYNFSLLWGISYFSYSLNPKTGGYNTIHQWKTTKLIDSAKAYNCKVFLSVSSFGETSNSIFLKNKLAQDNLTKNLIDLLAYRNANGINIDFEEVPSKHKKAFTNFIINLSTALKKVNPNYQVSLCLYAIDWHNVFNIKAIDKHIDFYTLMSYDYYGSFSKIAGPIAPLNTTPQFGRGVKSSVNYYFNKGVTPEKLIVGIPYYGVEWLTTEKNIPSKVKKFKTHLSYKTIMNEYIQPLNISIEFDSTSASNYITLKDKNYYKEIWFEDTTSLSIKYDWIKSTKISGVGIWALGYDEGYTELWHLLDNKFQK
ncbi:glycosyl hydrolase family 18 protein [Tenacibaculum sp. 190524A02b]